MQHLISALFIIEFFLILLIFFYVLFKEGVNFKVGISFGLLFFIFIPVWVMILSGKVELSKTDFGETKLTDVVLKDNIKSSFVLLLFIFSNILYLYFPSLKIKRLKDHKFKPKLNIYLLIYFIGMLIIFVGSGLLRGGNWYDNRHSFFESYGAFALLVAFILNSSKILIIVSLTYKWLKKEYTLLRFLFFVGSFTFLDMFFSGNRIYLFITLAVIGLVFIKRFPKKAILLTPIVIPSFFVLGYFASIFRHMRGPLFSQGLPTIEVFTSALVRAVILDPPKPATFFLGISESVNVNVIYKLFNNYNNFLYGSTYLKPFFFYMPRSVWESKPESITIVAAGAYGGASLVTTIIGEMYMNFSFLGIIILPVFLWFIDNLLTKSLNSYGSITGLIMFTFGLLIFRMPFSDEFLVFIFLVIILKLFDSVRNINLSFK